MFVFFLQHSEMRKRELQSFVVKLSDLKEYEVLRMERQEKRFLEKLASESPMTQTAPFVKFGPKSLKEVRERIGLD